MIKNKLIKKITKSEIFKKLYYNLSLGNKKIRLKDDIYGLFKKTLVKYEGFQEDIEGYVFYKKLREDDFIIDAGAYLGYFTTYASKKAKKGKVFAVEPIPWNFRLLKKHCRLNKLKNVTLINKALSNFEGTTYFDAKGGSSKISKEGKTKIKVTTIDKLIEKNKIPLNKIKFVKMDIEGSEIEAVKGAKKLINEGNSFWAIASYHLVNNKPTHHFLEKFFKKRGYEVFTKYHGQLTTYAYKK